MKRKIRKKAKATKKKMQKFTSKKIGVGFTSHRLTRYSGLTKILDYIKKIGIIELLSSEFPTGQENAIKFSKVQILLSILLSSLSGINRIVGISNFTVDSLVLFLLGLRKRINKDAIISMLKRMGERGARHLEKFLLVENIRYLSRTGLSSITIDGDSTVVQSYGNQEGAERGYNPTRRGGKSYHPLLLFVSELKLLFHSRFRSGSSHTSNGISSMLQELRFNLPRNIKEVFFRGDSGFFSGELLDILEEYGWSYLLKVKLKNFRAILLSQSWGKLDVRGKVSVCEFEYRCQGWSKSRKLKGVRILKEYVERGFLGVTERVPVYDYFCYVSDLELSGKELHKRYNERSVSENWISEVKEQLLAGKTLLNSFWSNDILWQMNVLAYNISLMMRYRIKKYHRQEHKTFREWFILVPGKIVSSGNVVSLKMYKSYYYRYRWGEFATLLTL